MEDNNTRLDIYWLKEEGILNYCSESESKFIQSVYHVRTDFLTAFNELKKEGFSLQLKEIDEDNREVPLQEVLDNMDDDDYYYLIEVYMYNSQGSCQKFNELLHQWKFSVYSY